MTLQGNKQCRNVYLWHNFSKLQDKRLISAQSYIDLYIILYLSGIVIQRENTLWTRTKRRENFVFRWWKTFWSITIFIYTVVEEACITKLLLYLFFRDIWRAVHKVKAVKCWISNASNTEYSKWMENQKRTIGEWFSSWLCVRIYGKTNSTIVKVKTWKQTYDWHRLNYKVIFTVVCVILTIANEKPKEINYQASIWFEIVTSDSE